MDLENTFAANVFNAPRIAAEFAKAGIAQSVPDVISMALTDLWAFRTAGHFSSDYIATIVDKYVRYDANDEAWPRDDIDWGNMVALER